VNLSVKKNENRSTFGEVMDNIVVPCFLTHSVQLTSGDGISASLQHVSVYIRWQ